MIIQAESKGFLLTNKNGDRGSENQIRFRFDKGVGGTKVL
jgi:hypothetical protein